MRDFDNTIIFYSETKYILNRTRKLSEERIGFLGGKRLGDVPIRIEDNACCRKIRRIVEKREVQSFWRNGQVSKQFGNGARYHTRHNVSNQFKNLFEEVPEGFHHCA